MFRLQRLGDIVQNPAAPYDQQHDCEADAGKDKRNDSIGHRDHDDKRRYPQKCGDRAPPSWCLLLLLPGDICPAPPVYALCKTSEQVLPCFNAPPEGLVSIFKGFLRNGPSLGFGQFPLDVRDASAYPGDLSNMGTNSHLPTAP